jgi:glycosyltransferase involved in cell wall biosynthesis
MKLSAVINTKNAADTIEKTLKSVQFADEIVVVDMHSLDQTRKIARKYTSKIFLYDDVGYVEPARNFAIAHAKHDYVLLIDADEIIGKSLQHKIMALLARESPADVYLIPRKNFIFGQWIQHTGWWPDYQARLFKKEMVHWSEHIHQEPTVHGRVVKLQPHEKLAIEHQNYPTVSSYLERLNRYSSHQAKNLTQGFSQQLTPSTLLQSYFGEFFKRLFVFTGYKDQTIGVGLSLLQATYELAVQLKLWEIQATRRGTQDQAEIIHSLESIRGDLNYWLADWQVKNSVGFFNLYWRFRRKFRI